jgi:hypothetical protein
VAIENWGRKEGYRKQKLKNLESEIRDNLYPNIIKAQELTFFPSSPEFMFIRSDLIDFMERHVFGNERLYLKQLGTGSQRWKGSTPILEHMRYLAKSYGLWNFWKTHS